MSEIDCMACVASGAPARGIVRRVDGITHGTLASSGRGRPLCRLSEDVPAPTNDEMFRNGWPVLLLTGPRSHTIQAWIDGVAEDVSARIDWRLAGGWALILAVGDPEELGRVRAALADRIEDLVDAYMACEDNFTRNPERSDVQWQPYGESTI
jgi:hypothetical protein